MSIKSALISSLLLGFASVSVTGAVGAASVAEPVSLQEEARKKKRKTRKVPSMTLAVNKKVTKAQEYIELQDIPAAMEVLNDLQASTKINDYERSIVWQLLAQIRYDQGDVAGTIAAYEEVLKLKDSIPEAVEVNIIFNLSQLAYSEEDFDKAIAYYKDWETKAVVIGVKQVIYGAQLYYVTDNFQTSIDYAKRAIAEAEAIDTIDVEENWYGLMLSSYWELAEYENVRDVLEILIINWPSPSYWQQLAGTYQELGQDETSYSIIEAAYKQGFLDDKPAQLENMAQILIAREVPIKATWVLEQAYRDGLLEKTAKNQRTLGNGYLRATEYAKSVGPLAVAAKGDDTLEPDGTLWLQIASVQNQLDNLNDAVDAYDNAIKLLKAENKKANKGKIRAAYMQRAGALIELKKYDSARKSFDEARKLGEKRSTLKSWLDYLKGEEAREEILASAGR